MYNGWQKILNYIYEPYTATVVVILAFISLFHNSFVIFITNKVFDSTNLISTAAT